MTAGTVHVTVAMLVSTQRRDVGKGVSHISSFHLVVPSRVGCHCRNTIVLTQCKDTLISDLKKMITFAIR